MNKSFLAMRLAQGNTFLNLDAVREIIYFDDGSGCRLRFSESHYVELTGIGAAQLLNNLRERAVPLGEIKFQ